MRRSKLSVLLSLLGVLILLVAACAPAATPTPTATATPPPVVATPTPTVVPGIATPIPGVATPTPEGLPTLAQLEALLQVPTAAQYGGVLYYNQAATPTHWDGQRSMSVSTQSFTGPIYGSLVRFNSFAALYLPEYIEPELAERWEVSPDGKVYTFYLRKGVKFHDGRPFTAKDVKYSLEKLQDPKQSNFPIEFSVIDRVDVVDDYTAKVYLKFPAGLFLPLLAQGMTNMRPEHLKDVSYRTTAFLVGTGPFKFKSMSVGVEVVYEKNPDYWAKGQPYLDSIVIVTLAAEASFNAFLGGRLDMVGAGSDDDFATLKRIAPEARIYIKEAYPVLRGLFFNFVKEGPWQDVRVRKAMAMVLDYPGGALAAVGDVPLADGRGGFFGSEPLGVGLPWSEYEKSWWLSRPLEARIAEAKRLLAEAGYPTGFKGEIFSTSVGRSYDAPTLLAQDLWKRYLNIDLAFLKMDRAAAIERMNRGAFDIAFAGYVATIGDPQQFISSVYIAGGGDNYGKYAHPKVAELYREIEREMDPKRRIALIHQVERLLIADIPIIPMYKAASAYAYRPYLKNYAPHHPFWSWWGSFPVVLWFDKNDPTWAKRTIGR